MQVVSLGGLSNKARSFVYALDVFFRQKPWHTDHTASLCFDDWHEPWHCSET